MSVHVGLTSEMMAMSIVKITKTMTTMNELYAMKPHHGVTAESTSFSTSISPLRPRRRDRNVMKTDRYSGISVRAVSEAQVERGGGGGGGA
jgi:hypothetical protein